jgi:hypothetical protein
MYVRKSSGILAAAVSDRLVVLWVIYSKEVWSLAKTTLAHQ